MDRSRRLGWLAVALLGAGLAPHAIADGYLGVVAFFTESDSSLDGREAMLARVPDSPEVRRELAAIRAARRRERLLAAQGAAAGLALSGQLLALTLAAVALGSRRRRLATAAAALAALAAAGAGVELWAGVEGKQLIAAASAAGLLASVAALAALLAWRAPGPGSPPGRASPRT
jgi:hypothetical protein